MYIYMRKMGDLGLKTKMTIGSRHGRQNKNHTLHRGTNQKDNYKWAGKTGMNIEHVGKIAAMGWKDMC